MNFSVLSMEFFIRNRLPFFYQTDGNFYQIILSHTQGRSGVRVEGVRVEGVRVEVARVEKECE